MRVNIRVEGPIVRVLTVGALKAWDWAAICRLSLMKRRQTLTLKPGGGGVPSGGAGTIPVDHGARGPLQPPRVGQSGV